MQIKKVFSCSVLAVFMQLHTRAVFVTVSKFGFIIVMRTVTQMRLPI